LECWKKLDTRNGLYIRGNCVVLLQYYFFFEKLLAIMIYIVASRSILAKYSNGIMISFAISQVLKKHIFYLQTIHVSDSPWKSLYISQIPFFSVYWYRRTCIPLRYVIAPWHVQNKLGLINKIVEWPFNQCTLYITYENIIIHL